jgi:hypothetical protein
MKTYGGSRCITPHILDLITRWRWVVSFTPRPLYPQGKSSGTHWIGDWVGPRAVLDTVVKRKISSPRRESNPRHFKVLTIIFNYFKTEIKVRKKAPHITCTYYMLHRHLQPEIWVRSYGLYSKLLWDLLTMSKTDTERKTLCKVMWQYGGRTHGAPIQLWNKLVPSC